MTDSPEQSPTKEDTSKSNMYGIVWRELIENLMRFVFASKETDANTGARLMAWGRCGPAIRNSDWVTVVISLEVEGEGTLDTDRIAKVLRIPSEKVVLDMENNELTVTTDCGAENGAADPPTVALFIKNILSSEVLKGAAGRICTSQSPKVLSMKLIKITTSPYCTEYRLPAWRWRYAFAGPSLPYEQKLVLEDEIDSFSRDIIPGDHENGVPDRDHNTELALRYTTSEVIQLVNLVKERWQKHTGCFIAPPGKIPREAEDRTYAAPIFEKTCYSSPPDVQKKLHSIRQKLFTFLCTAILEERERRIKALTVTIPFRGGPRKSSSAIRTDPKVTCLKQVTLYNKESNKAYPKSTDPHRVLHRSVFGITSIGSSATASDLTLNCSLLRDAHPTKKIFNAGWDPYCCIRHTAHSGGGRGITNFNKVNHH